MDSSLAPQTRITVPSGVLANNVLYYWRVRSQNAAGNGPWTFAFRFRTIVALPNAPGLIFPVNNASNVPLLAHFDWDSTSPVIYYNIQGSVDSTFSPPNEIDQTGVTESNYDALPGELQNNFRYYWRVSAVNAAGQGPWSPHFRFTTVFGIPAAPQLLAPADNSTGISLTPTLDWVDDISVTSYQLQLSADSTFATTLIDSTGSTASSIVVRSGLLTNVVKYYWRVKTTNSIGTGPFSQPWRFTTLLNAPAAPVLADPLNNATGITTTPTLDWNAVPFASTYRVQLATDSLFTVTSLLINSPNVPSSQYPVSGGVLQNNTAYYWRVNATNTAGTGPYSPIWKFNTVISPPVAAPNLISPPNFATGQTATPTLDWNDVFGSNGYKVLVSNDSLFNTTVLDSTLTPSQITIPSGRLVGNTTYYWRVRAFNAGGFGPYSVTWRFTTGPIGISVISTEIPAEFKLYNNYPNPFNPITKIKFDVPPGAKGQITNIKIAVYDILGKEQLILLNRQIQPGRYEVEWNAENYSSGIYFYRITAGEFTDIKKMVLVK